MLPPQALIVERLHHLLALRRRRVYVGGIGPAPPEGAGVIPVSRLNFVVRGAKRLWLPLDGQARELRLGLGEAHFSLANTWELQRWDSPHELLCIVPRAEYLRVSLYRVSASLEKTCDYHHSNRPHTPAFLHLLQALEALAREPGRTLPEGLVTAFIGLAAEAASQPPGELSDRAAQRCAEIRRYIENTFQEGLTREAVARHFQLTPGHLSHLFRATYGSGVGACIVGCRMQLAESLLRETGLTVAQVAAQSGHGTVVHFVRAFRLRHGLPPGRWRASVAPASSSPADPGRFRP